MAKQLSSGQIGIAVQALAAGQLLAFPTETVYGLGADASQPDAVGKVFAAKGRPTSHPLIVHMLEPGDLDRFGRNITGTAGKLAAAFWPGPLTLIVARSGEVAPEVVAGGSTVGLRVPDHPVALDMLRRFGGGVAAPSANRFGAVSPTTAQHVIDDLGDVVDFVIDGGPCPVGVESTIVDVVTDTPILLRPGGISTVELEAAVGRAVIDGRTGSSKAPGMLASHYAPTAVVELVDAHWLRLQSFTIDGKPDYKVGIVAPFSHAHPVTWTLPGDAKGYAAQLYAALRHVDRSGVSRILVAPPESGELLEAVNDRLSKAAAPRSRDNLAS